MTKLQRMVYEDAFIRVLNTDVSKAMDISPLENYAIPSDMDIKCNGYEGAVEQVYQQMNSAGETE